MYTSGDTFCKVSQERKQMSTLTPRITELKWRNKTKKLLPLSWGRDLVRIISSLLAFHDDVIKWKTFSVFLALCVGNSPVTGEFPSQRPETRSFDVFFDERLNKRWSKQSWRRWFGTPSRSLWRHCNGGFTNDRTSGWTLERPVDQNVHNSVNHIWNTPYTVLIMVDAGSSLGACWEHYIIIKSWSVDLETLTK